jgi:hypothetical protein
MNVGVIIGKLFGVTGLWFIAGIVLAGDASTNAITPEIQIKLDARTKAIASWAADPVIVDAVKAHNKGLSEEAAAMTQEQWAVMPVTSRFLYAFSHNPAAEVLKAKRTPEVTEAFISGEDGIKVAFLAKTTNWSHKGKPKHDVPMSGKNWQGKIELDESTGYRQIQISVPVLDAGKPIGSLVVGLNVEKLGE